MIDLQAFRKIRRNLRLMDYCFLKQLFYSLRNTSSSKGLNNGFWEGAEVFW